MENRPEVLACVIAAVKLGAVAAMLNHNQRGEVLSHSIKLVKAKLLVVSDECGEAIESTEFTPTKTPSLSYMWCSDAPETTPSGWHNLAKEAARCSEANPESTGKVLASQPCFFIFTSGTTGLPKASVMTHYRWLLSLIHI